MQRYSEWAPTSMDTRGLALDDRQDWFVAPVIRTRDSGVTDRANFESFEKLVEEEQEKAGDDEVFELHRFGHWACGWLEIILLKPDTDAAKLGEDVEAGLADYPVVDDEHHSEVEHEEAQETWAGSYSDAERLAFVRKYRDEFEFRSFADLLGCVRGNHFCGETSRMVNY